LFSAVLFQPTEPPLNGGFWSWHEFGELLNQNVPKRLCRASRARLFEVEEMLSQMIERLKKRCRQRSLSMVLAGGALLSGGGALGFDQTEQPVTVSEVVRMSEENVPAETIVNKMRDSRTIYRLSAAQLAQLHDEGVQDEVINYMQQTYLDAVRREEDLANWRDWGMWGDHFW
jgi:hypothetical protein